jgi:EAL domain-containing protein (putative c-di-GMP-specific phosphodiesterase class I)
VRTAGCDVAQGFFISRPLAPDAFDAFLADRASRPRMRLAARS